MRKAALIAGAFILAVFMTTLTGCFRSDEQAATDVAREFLEAGKRGDDQAVKATLSQKANDVVNSNPNKKGSPLHANRSGDYTLGQAVISGDTAQVPVHAKGEVGKQEMQILLKREDRSWKVYGIAMAMPDGTKMTLNFEKPEELVGEMMKMLGTEMGRALSGVSTGMPRMMEGLQEGFKKGMDESKQSK